LNQISLACQCDEAASLYNGTLDRLQSKTVICEGTHPTDNHGALLRLTYGLSALPASNQHLQALIKYSLESQP
jgi:hypothetical protein